MTKIAITVEAFEAIAGRSRSAARVTENEANERGERLI